MQKITPIYTAEAVSTGGRRGHVRSSEGILDMDVSMPAEMGGNGGKANPELLFAAGYAACFGGALGAVAKGRDISGAEVKARVAIGKTEQGAFGLAVELHVSLPQLSAQEAEAIVAEAHGVCPYSLATQGNIEVKLFAQGKA